MARPQWTVVGVAGATQLHVAAVLTGDASRLLAGERGPREWVHVTVARTPAEARTWAKETYQEHLANRLAASVQVEVITSGKSPRALARWRKRRPAQ